MNTHHPVGAAAPIESHRLYFDGAGQTYFRVWLENLLLGIATLGLYVPWARRRNAQYFYGHTEVAGGAMEFTAPLRRMAWVGGALALAVWGGCALAARTGQARMLVLGSLVAVLLLPWAWGCAMRLRLDHTRWRGLAPRLRAGWGEIYAAAWPLFALALVWAGVGRALVLAAPFAGQRPPMGATLALAALLALSLLLTLLWLARLRFNLSRLAVQRSQVGVESGHWALDFSPFLRIALASAGIFLVGLLALAALCTLALDRGALPAWEGGTVRTAVLALGLALLGVLAAMPAWAFHDACTFRLVWNHVGVGQVARFACRLNIGAYVCLRTRNALLTLLSLGLYLPFSRVQRWRMKTYSVTLHLRGDPDDLAETLARQHAAKFGCAAARLGIRGWASENPA